MHLIALDKRLDLVRLGGGWLEDARNWRWLDPGTGVAPSNALSLRIMVQRGTHLVRAFTAPDGAPAGLVALSDIDPRFRIAKLWFLLGDKRYAGRGLTRRAAAVLLDIGFLERGLHAVYAWVAATNGASIRILQSLRFRLAGRQRQCHRIDDEVCDRLLFDLLKTEHQEVSNARNSATG